MRDMNYTYSEARLLQLMAQRTTLRRIMASLRTELRDIQSEIRQKQDVLEEEKKKRAER